jgi:Vitamin K-dependent gamma-carboxylase
VWARAWTALSGGSIANAERGLALLRVATSALVLASPESWTALQIAEQGAVGRLPVGLVWAQAVWPTSPDAVRLVVAVQQVALVFVLVGASTRVAAGVAALATLLAWTLAQTTGPTLHDMHLLWMLALLAASPCDRIWALERRTSDEDPRVAAQMARALLGVIYVFPGVHKALEGHAWFSGEILVAQAHVKMLLHGASVRFDRVPALPVLMASGAVFFELAFLPLALGRQTRGVAALMGLAFHLTNQWLMHIPFVSLWGLYVVLLPESILGRLGAPGNHAPPSGRSPAWIMGCALLMPASLFGALGITDGYPFACYPTFARHPGRSIPDLVLELEEGGRLEAPLGSRSDAEWGRVWRAIGAYGTPEREPLRREVRLLLGQTSCSHVRVIRVERSITPEAQGRVQRMRELGRYACDDGSLTLSDSEARESSEAESRGP